MTADFIYLVIKCVPDIYDDIVQCFSKEENAHNYIADNFPYVYYTDLGFYAMDNLTDKELETEERYYVVEKALH